MSGPGWEGLLDPGERVLWQGQPQPGLSFAPRRPGDIVTSLALCAFAVFWLWRTLGDIGTLPGLGRLFPLVGLVFLGIGLWKLGGDAFWRSVMARRTWYTLTDRRALVATDSFGRRELRSWPIDPATTIDYGGGEPGTIRFAGSRCSSAGGAFERVSDASGVHALMRKVQRGEA